MNRFFPILLAAALLAACIPTPTPSPDIPPDSIVTTPPDGLPPNYAPRPGDASLLRGEAFVDSADLLAMESFPLQFSVTLKGSLPTPCHELRAVIQKPDTRQRINLEVYSVVDPKAVCAQMLQPFEQGIPLGSFPAGHYTVWVNGKQVAEFDA